MKRLYAIIGMAGALCTPALQASMNITLLDDTSQYSYGVGGEFRAVGDSGLNSAVNWAAYSAQTQGTIGNSDTGSWGYSSGLYGQKYFQTFCTETSEEFSPGSQYAISSIGNNALYNSSPTQTPVPITMGVAYLYSQFAAGTLTGYDYTYGSGRAVSAGILQQAIWYLLGENQDNAQLAGFALTDLQNSNIQNWTAPANGAYGVGDMVLSEPGQAQDQLVMTAVPEPTTIISGVLMLLPFGASTLRILRRNRAA
jgi:hypothetical protein